MQEVKQQIPLYLGDLLFYIFICFKTQIKNSGAKVRKVLFAESLVDMETGVFYENVRNEEIHVYTLLLNTHKT